MKKNLTRVAVMATIVATLVGGFSVSAQAAGTATVQGNGSYGPLNLFQGGSYVSSAATSFGWSDNVIASASISDVTSAFTCPAGSENPAAFLSARDHETIIGDWKAFASGSFISGTQTFAQTNLKPAGLTSGTPGAGAVKAVGGDYSLGVACVSNGGVTVDRVYYRYIHVATDGTGAWTAEATDYVYATPTVTVTQSADNAAHTPAFAKPHVGDTLNATVGANIPDGFNVAYQWYANGNAVSGATNNTYTTVANDAGKVFTVVATYTRSGYTTVNKTSAAVAAVEGDAVVTGDVTVSATVAGATNGQLALDTSATTSANLSTVNVVNNYSQSTGDLGQLTVKDGRVVTRDGWDLTVSATDFVKSNDSNTKIYKQWLQFTPFVVSSPANGNVQAGTASVAGSTTYPYTLAYQAALGNTQAENTVGDTVVNAHLMLKAPQYKPAGTYTATLTVTVASR